MSYLITLADIFLPRLCVGCGREGTAACEACLRTWTRPRVEHRTIPGIDQLVSVGAYKAGFAQRLVSRWKFEGDRSVAQIVARAMSAAVGPVVADNSCVYTPIPLHDRKLYQRGFNQAADVAEKLTQFGGYGYAPLLIRTRSTKPQKELDDMQKAKNVHGAFGVDTHWWNAQPPTRVILIDDIATSGATLEQAASCLRAWGVRQVSACVLARG